MTGQFPGECGAVVGPDTICSCPSFLSMRNDPGLCVCEHRDDDHDAELDPTIARAVSLAPASRATGDDASIFSEAEQALNHLSRWLTEREDPRRYGVNCALRILWLVREGKTAEEALQDFLNTGHSRARGGSTGKNK